MRTAIKRPLTAAAIAFTVAFVSVASADQRVPARRIMTSHVLALTGGLKPTGSLPATESLGLIIGLPLREQAKLKGLIREVYNPASPNYRHYLTPAEFTRMFAPSQADYQALQAFAKANHLQIVATVPNRTLLHVKASVADIARVFHVTLQIYRHPTEDRSFFAPDREPLIDLGIPVLRITGLDNLSLPFPGPRKTGSIPKPNAGSGSAGQFTGKDLRAAYAPNVTLTGAGQIVGILSFGGYLASDIQMYAARAGTPNVSLQNVDLPGFSANPTQDILPNTEATLDVEMVVAMAPGVSKIVVYRAPYDSIPTVLNEMANPTQGEPQPSQLSTSFAINYGANASNEQIFQQMALQGQSFFAASGDFGAYGLNSRSGDFPPGDSEFVTSVGGTVLTTSGPGGVWVSETAWSSSGGGYGWFPLPSWQIAIGTATNAASTTLRNCPDVSAVATNIEIARLGGFTGVAGTSASAPLWAGFTALINQQAAANGLARVGFLNPALYALGFSAQHTSAFHDITSGSNANGNVGPNFVAGTGYDLVTGWGTPKGINLINALALRQPLNLPLTGAYLRYSSALADCDPGPVAGALATFVVHVAGGAPPFSYDWSATTVPINDGGGNSPIVVVQVPAAGSSGTLAVTVTDGAGNQVTASLAVSGIDPILAGEEEALCRLLANLYRFKRPIYIDPGDPAKVRFNPYSAADLKSLEELSREVSVRAGVLQRERR